MQTLHDGKAGKGRDPGLLLQSATNKHHRYLTAMLKCISLLLNSSDLSGSSGIAIAVEVDASRKVINALVILFYKADHSCSHWTFIVSAYEIAVEKLEDVIHKQHTQFELQLSKATRVNEDLNCRLIRAAQSARANGHCTSTAMKAVKRAMEIMRESGIPEQVAQIVEPLDRAGPWSLPPFLSLHLVFVLDMHATPQPQLRSRHCGADEVE